MSKGWKMVKLGEEFDLQMGKTPDRKNDTYWNAEENLWVSIADMSNCSSKYIVSTKETISDYATINMKQVPKGTVIMSFKLSIGKVSITDANLYTNEAIMAFLPRNDYYADFLYYRLLSFAWTEGLNKAVKGITLNKASISNTKMLFPSFEQQKRIVATLDKASELIALHKKQLEELDVLAESVFYDMFGDPVKNEKGWKIMQLRDMKTKIGSGATPKGGNSCYKLEGINFIRSLNVYNGEFKYKDLAYIDDEQAKKLNNVTVLKNDILLNITGASVARCCIVPDALIPARVNQHVAIIRVNDSLNNRYLVSLLTNNQYQKELLRISKSNGATREALTKNDIEDLKIPTPSPSLQTRFAAIIEKIEQQKALVKKALQESEDLFQRLMQDLFKPD